MTKAPGPVWVEGNWREQLDAMRAACAVDAKEATDADWWKYLLHEYAAGRLYKADIADALRAGKVPPREALEMLADVLDGDGRPLCNGRRPVRAGIAYPLATKVRGEALLLYSLNWPDPPRQRIKEWLADQYQVTVKSVEAWTSGIEDELLAHFEQSRENTADYRRWLYYSEDKK